MFCLSDTMKFLIVSVLGFATVSAKNLDSRSIEVSVLENEGRITNGKIAEPGEFYYQAGIALKKITKWQWCGGSFIGNNWILTAAHCTEDTLRAKVYLGATQRLVAEKVYNASQDDIIIHPDWNKITSNNDIALIRIPTTSESDKIGIVRIPSKYDTNNYVGFIVVISGWGFINDNSNELSNDLRYGILKVSPGNVCSDFFTGEFNYDKLICVATPNKVSSCHADSGGPLVLDGQNLQIGLVSFGSKKGCAKGFPTAFTRVSAHLSWIRSHTRIDYLPFEEQGKYLYQIKKSHII